MLLLASGELLLPAQRARLEGRAGPEALTGPLGDELASLRAQVGALLASSEEETAATRCG